MRTKYGNPKGKSCFIELKEASGATSLIRLDDVSRFSEHTQPDGGEPRSELTLASGMSVLLHPTEANRIRKALSEIKS
jgi:hypothetical protein